MHRHTQHEKHGTTVNEETFLKFSILSGGFVTQYTIFSSPSITPHDRDDYQDRIGA